jgi:protein-tyrosine sulfotransferase
VSSELQLTPVFIIGVPRSGTTLLRVLLDSHPRIAGAPETAWIAGGYGERSLKELLLFLCNSEIGPVRNLSGVDRNTLLLAGRRFLDAIFEDYLRARDRSFLVLKTPDDVLHVEFLLNLYPDAKFIHIHRDGRDVACSTNSQKGRFFGVELPGYGELNVGIALKRWYDWDSKVRALFATGRFDYRNICYEELVQKPENPLAEMTKFIGVRFQPDMTNYALQEHEYPSWEAGSSDVQKKEKIDATGVGRWREQIPKTHWDQIDRLYGDYLEGLGYARCNAHT